MSQNKTPTRISLFTSKISLLSLTALLAFSLQIRLSTAFADDGGAASSSASSEEGGNGGAGQNGGESGADNSNGGDSNGQSSATAGASTVGDGQATASMGGDSSTPGASQGGDDSNAATAPAAPAAPASNMTGISSDGQVGDVGMSTNTSTTSTTDATASPTDMSSMTSAMTGVMSPDEMAQAQTDSPVVTNVAPTVNSLTDGLKSYAEESISSLVGGLQSAQSDPVGAILGCIQGIAGAFGASAPSFGAVASDAPAVASVANDVSQIGNDTATSIEGLVAKLGQIFGESEPAATTTTAPETISFATPAESIVNAVTSPTTTVTTSQEVDQALMAYSNMLGQMTVSDLSAVMAPINAVQSFADSTNNCFSNAVAFASSLAGAPASATGAEIAAASPVNATNVATALANLGMETTTVTTDASLSYSPSILAKLTPGDQAMVAMSDPTTNMAHVFNAVNINGTAVFADAQTGQISTSLSSLASIYGFSPTSSVTVVGLAAKVAKN